MTVSTGSEWKGIVLAGGTGSRLYPITVAACKQLLPVFDKPMVYYPISMLIMHGVKDILIISTPKDLPRFEELLGDGSRLGVKFSYIVQDEPKGIAEAFVLGAEFIGDSNVILLLGDNIFYGDMDVVRRALDGNVGGTVFGYPVTMNMPHMPPIVVPK